MPELPEVQTIVNFLKPKIVNKKIIKIESLSSRTIRGHKNISEIENKIVGRKITDVTRVGKHVVLHLSGGDCLLFHLMMTGKLLINPTDGKHDRFRMFLSGGIKVVFNDIRKFGKCQVVSNPRILVGPDPLEISFEEFQKILSVKNKNTPIKIFLLDQRFLSGIGNIYADEILWDAGINPLRKINTLEKKEIKVLYNSSRKVLNFAIQKKGTSSRDYRLPDGSEGEYYKFRKVYQRTDSKCPRCGGVIIRVVLGGRATHFCPKHQK